MGAGYVGLVSAACLAELGNQVICLDIDDSKISGLAKGQIPIFEPGLERLVKANAAAGRLSFTTNYADAVRPADFVFIAVDTPIGHSGRADLSSIEAAARGIGRYLRRGAVIVDKSTVPVGTGDLVEEVASQVANVPVRVVANPEFLREGSAVDDFLGPDRIVLGTGDPAAADLVADLYADFSCPVVRTDLRTAEMIKYASNAYLAARISFINEIAAICERVGANVGEVAEGMGLDSRIGPKYLQAGIGWGGSCFGKDVLALEHMAAAAGSHPQLLRAIVEINRDARLGVLRRLRDLLGDLRGKRIALLGLAFKPNTDDIRDSPALDIARLLLADGAKVFAYDPMAGERVKVAEPRACVTDSPWSALAGADAAVLCTEWPEFSQLDWSKVADEMHGDVVIDGRNALDGQQLTQLGLRYRGVGRGTP